MPTLRLTWHAVIDDRTCPICKELGRTNYAWEFDSKVTEFPTELLHPVFGPIWNVAQGSKVHELHRMKGECRCNVMPEVDFQDVIEILTKIRDSLKKDIPLGEQI